MKTPTDKLILKTLEEVRRHTDLRNAQHVTAHRLGLSVEKVIEALRKAS